MYDRNARGNPKKSASTNYSPSTPNGIVIVNTIWKILVRHDTIKKVCCVFCWRSPIKKRQTSKWINWVSKNHTQRVRIAAFHRIRAVFPFFFLLSSIFILMRKRRVAFVIDPKFPTVRFNGRKTNLLQTMSKTLESLFRVSPRCIDFPIGRFSTFSLGKCLHWNGINHNYHHSSKPDHSHESAKWVDHLL